MTSPVTLTDYIGRTIEAGKLAIITVDERLSVGLVVDVYETTGAYAYRGRKTIKVKRVKLSLGTVSKPTTGMLQDHRKIVIVDNFNFLPAEMVLEIEKKLGLTI